MNAVDLFCGIGWSFACDELGIDEHGIDIEPTVAKTRDRLGWATTCADILDLDPLDWAGVDGLIASPPCQSWSRAGKGAGLNDPRGQLVWQPLVWALAIRPRWVACEQVPEARGAFELIAHRLREVGYHAAVYVLSSETFGVAQTRRRVFLAAHRDRPIGPPTMTHQRYRKGRPRVEPVDMLGHLPWVSWGEALNLTGDIDRRQTGAPLVPGDAPAPTVTVESGAKQVWLMRYVRGAGMLERHGDRPDRFADEPALTTTTRAGAGHLHELRCGDEVRHLTEAQGCRLMGFPDGTADVLEGNKADRWRQIGNAVCPPVAAAVLRTLANPSPPVSSSP